VGWRIDIKSEEEKRQEVEAEMARMQRIVEELRSLPGVPENITQKLIDSGVAGIDHILQMTDEDLCSIEGIGAKTAEKIREAATEAKVEWDRRDAEEAALYEQERLAAEAPVEEPPVDETAQEQETESAGTTTDEVVESESVAPVQPAEGGTPDDER